MNFKSLYLFLSKTDSRFLIPPQVFVYHSTQSKLILKLYLFINCENFSENEIFTLSSNSLSLGYVENNGVLDYIYIYITIITFYNVFTIFIKYFRLNSW